MVEASRTWGPFSSRSLEVIKIGPKACAAAVRHHGSQLIGQRGLAGRRESVHANSNRMRTFDPGDHPGQTLEDHRAPSRIGARRRTPLVHAPEPSQTSTGRTLPDAAPGRARQNYQSRAAGSRLTVPLLDESPVAFSSRKPPEISHAALGDHDVYVVSWRRHRPGQIPDECRP